MRAASLPRRQWTSEGSLKKALAKEKGGEISDAMMEEFKSIVTEVLTPYASAILIDPEWGLPAVKKARARTRACSSPTSRRDTTPRVPAGCLTCCPGRSAAEGRRRGGVKILIYYTPIDTKTVNEEKHAFVERIGAECRA